MSSSGECIIDVDEILNRQNKAPKKDPTKHSWNVVPAQWDKHLPLACRDEWEQTHANSQGFYFIILIYSSIKIDFKKVTRRLLHDSAWWICQQLLVNMGLYCSTGRGNETPFHPFGIVLMPWTSVTFDLCRDNSPAFSHFSHLGRIQYIHPLLWLVYVHASLAHGWPL